MVKVVGLVGVGRVAGLVVMGKVGCSAGEERVVG